MLPRCLVLWDVDHTLIETRGVGSAVFREAFEKATGATMSAGMATAHGHTEPVLLEKTLELNGIQDREEGLFERFAAAQADGYRARSDELRERGRVLPGIEDALGALATDSGVMQSVLTGNTRRAAQVKLSAFGLDRHLDLAVGAYGDDDSYRPRLVEVALARAAERAGMSVPRERVVLIGDTPKDIAAAREAGVGVIAVASGTSSVDDLTGVGADLVLGTLESVDIRDLVGRVLTVRAGE
ncbi:HAD family hydrolase [Streptomonospora salina]|uniref:Phosphoglycolate phosphatase-like HAD superfamily hydrolase n=1 Tax=Streptomonospora salina TaxID=104205 RepID=A0A841EF98_9ACTN|nr:HAD hydrolase-like protein [Streptomonospora salina]MBB5998091.1 phosphoglycolate phosphatase-like HAD superfamily hydrolase [Streptomonospora salina]